MHFPITVSSTAELLRSSNRGNGLLSSTPAAQSRGPARHLKRLSHVIVEKTAHRAALTLPFPINHAETWHGAMPFHTHQPEADKQREPSNVLMRGRMDTRGVKLALEMQDRGENASDRGLHRPMNCQPVKMMLRCSLSSMWSLLAPAAERFYLNNSDNPVCYSILKRPPLDKWTPFLLDSFCPAPQPAMSAYIRTG